MIFWEEFFSSDPFVSKRGQNVQFSQNRDHFGKIVSIEFGTGASTGHLIVVYPIEGIHSGFSENFQIFQDMIFYGILALKGFSMIGVNSFLNNLMESLDIFVHQKITNSFKKNT